MHPLSRLPHYSNPIITSSLIPQSLGLGGLSSSEWTLALPFLLFLSSLLEPPILNPLLLLLLILELSDCSGGGVLEEEKEDKRVRSDIESGLSCVGVGEGVISVLELTSTSSASRYHFRRRV
jgi:hypothetical protein